MLGRTLRPALPLSRLAHVVAEGHPLGVVNSNQRPGYDVVQLLRPGDNQIIEAAHALECELAVLGVVEQFFEEFLSLVDCVHVVVVSHCFVSLSG